MNVADRVTVPDLHRTVASNPVTVGEDDHSHHWALWTVVVHSIVPPLAVRWRVGTVAAPAVLATEGAARVTKATTATRTTECLMFFIVHHAFLRPNWRNLSTRYVSADRTPSLTASQVQRGE